MSVAIVTHPSTADGLLFGDQRQAAVALSQAIDGQRVLDSVQQQAGRADALFRDALGGRLVEAGGELLVGLNLGAALLGGWYKYRGLQAAARRTLENPGSGETVRLAEHRIVSRHAPYVDVVVNGQVAARVTFGIDLAFDIAMLQASVRAGRLMRLSAGECTASITWSLQGFEVARNESAPIQLPLHASLGEGIPLVAG